MVDQSEADKNVQAHLADVEKISVLEVEFLEALLSFPAKTTFEQLQELATKHQFKLTLGERKTDPDGRLVDDYILELKYPGYEGGGGITISGFFDDQESAIKNAYQFVKEQLTKGIK